MLRHMERSTVHLLAKRGKSIRQIAAELGRSPTTIARLLQEPIDHQPAPRQRISMLSPYRSQVEEWLHEGLSGVRMLELARTALDQPYVGSRSHFGELVRRVRLEVEQARAGRDVPIRFEGMAGEYLQVDWGEIRRFRFTQQRWTTRYFLCCRLKYSRWSLVSWTSDMRQETLFRGLVTCFCLLGFVPWVLIFDNMKTVTTGRDASAQPIWHPALLQLAAEFDFHPQACDPGAGNQKGSVESLVKWVKGNFLAGRSFVDDADLTQQNADWLAAVNRRPSDATRVPPLDRVEEETARGGRLPATAADYGFFAPGRVSAEALVAVEGNRYSVPVTHVGATVTVRLHREHVRIWRDTILVADHQRALAGSRQRLIDPTHFAPVLERKPRAQAMLERDLLLRLGSHAPAFLAALSRQHRARLVEEVHAVYVLFQGYGETALLAAMAQAELTGTCTAAALALLLAEPPPLVSSPAALILPGVPSQDEIDRQLGVYEEWVQVDEALEEVAS